MRYTKLMGLSQAIYSVFGAIGFCIVIYTSSVIFETQTQTLILIAIIFSRLLPKVGDLYFPFQNYLYLKPSLEAVKDLIDRCEQALEPQHSSVVFEPHADIKLHDVSYQYPRNKSLAVKQLSLTLNSRQLISIKGKSGIGKTTLLDLLAGIASPTSGSITIGGQALELDNRINWRKHVFYVPQEPFLIGGTIADNLCLLLQEAPNEQEMFDALEKADANFVHQLPHGLDTKLSDEGAGLSAGQRQRLLLTRALLSKKPVVLLDETTSNIDPESESKIIDTLNQLKATTTAVIVSHRPSLHAVSDLLIDIDRYS